MCVHARVHACVPVHVYCVCVYVSMYFCLSVSVYACVMHACWFVKVTWSDMFRYMCVCVFVCVCVCVACMLWLCVHA